MKFEWEDIFFTAENEAYGSGGARTIRGKVPGGWIVDHLVWNDDKEVQSQSSVFVPDPNHEWEIDKRFTGLENLCIGSMQQGSRPA